MATFVKLSNKASNEFRFYRSIELVAPADGTYMLISLQQFTFVKGVWLWVKKAFVGGTPEVTVGYQGNKEVINPAGFISSDIADVKVVGMKDSNMDTLLSTESKYFIDGPGVITLTVAANGATTIGNLMVFADCSIIW